MGVQMRDAMRDRLRVLRYERTERRARARIGGKTVVDSVRAPTARPRTPACRSCTPASRSACIRPPARRSICARAARLASGLGSEPPIPTWPATSCSTSAPSTRGTRRDEELLGHPRDPFHRIDIRHSSRHERIERDGVVLADSSRPLLLFETSLPTGFYIPREDVVTELGPSRRRTTCAYKGHASYFSVGGLDLAWTYERPLREAAAISNVVAFFDELVDVAVDGVGRDRPVTPFAKAILDESGVT